MKNKIKLARVLSLSLLLVLTVATLFACKTNQETELKTIALNSPEKVYYLKGESLDLRGGQIIASYSDSTTKNIELTETHISGFDKNKYGTQILTVTLEDKTASFAVTVADYIIENAEQFVSALDRQNDGNYWLLKNDIKLNSQVEIFKNITIDGNGKTLEFNLPEAEEGYTPSLQTGMVIRYTPAYIKDITMKFTEEYQGWHSRYVLQTYMTTGDVTLENITLKNGDAGLYVNTSKVVFAGTVDVSGNEFGGVEVSRSKLATELQVGELVIPESVVVINTTESESHPTIWVIDNQGMVTTPDNKFNVVEGKGLNADQTFYFLKK